MYNIFNAHGVYLKTYELLTYIIKKISNLKWWLEDRTEKRYFKLEKLQTKIGSFRDEYQNNYCNCDMCKKNNKGKFTIK